MDVRTFICKVEEIATEDPSYEYGGDGSAGKCDCIGLIIGAIRRAGGSWRGIHGSNYAARQAMVGLKKISVAESLSAGEIVYKARTPDDARYALPDRYKKGGAYYNGDLLDYYHVGVVESVSPLRIRHMTTPKATMDTRIGKWTYHGWLKDLSEKERDVLMTVIVSGGTASSPINMRSGPGTGYKILQKIPQGAEAELIKTVSGWAKVRYNNTEGYVMSEFVRAADADEKITLSRSRLKEIYDAIGAVYDELGDDLGLRG